MDTAPAGSGLGRRAAANTVLLLVARIASRLLALMAVLVIQRRLAADEFGAFSTVVTYGALAGVVVDLGFNTLYVREAARRLDQLERYLDNVLSVKALLAVVGFAVFAGLLWWRGFDDLVLPGFALLLTAAYSNLLRNTFYATGRLVFEAVDLVLESAVLVVLCVVGLQTGQGVAFFLLAYAASYAVACVWFAACIVLTGTARLRWRLESDLLWRWLVTGLPLVATSLIANIYWRADVPILQAAKGDTEVGWYALAYKPFEALLFVPFTVRGVVFPVLGVLHRTSPEALRRGIRSLYRALLALGWPCTVGLLVLAPNITTLLHFRYPEAEPSLRILAVAVVFMFVDNTFVTALTAMDRQGLYAWIAGLGLVANVGMNLAVIPRFGYLGASWTTVATEVILCVAGWIALDRAGVRLQLLGRSWRILAAGAGMGLALLPLRSLDGLATLVPVAVGAVVYAALVAVLRAADAGELALLHRPPRQPPQDAVRT
ncbi:MAG TPA: flippase [Candidatus Dormibacteraeota bacterium]|nr:flippase [Candidatus Dormibacteraeota bacterium]